MPPQCRLGDKSFTPLEYHGCPMCPHPASGPAVSGSPNVNVNHRPAVRMTDVGVHEVCCLTNTWQAVSGSPTVFINGLAAHRLHDLDQHCGGMGMMIEASPDVFCDSGFTNPLAAIQNMAEAAVDAAAGTVTEFERAIDDPEAAVDRFRDHAQAQAEATGQQYAAQGGELALDVGGVHVAVSANQDGVTAAGDVSLGKGTTVGGSAHSNYEGDVDVDGNATVKVGEATAEAGGGVGVNHEGDVTTSAGASGQGYGQSASGNVTVDDDGEVSGTTTGTATLGQAGATGGARVDDQGDAEVNAAVAVVEAEAAGTASTDDDEQD